MVNVILELLEWVLSVRANHATLRDVRHCSEMPFPWPRWRSVPLHQFKYLQAINKKATATPVMAWNMKQMSANTLWSWVDEVLWHTQCWCLLISAALSDCKREISLRPLPVLLLDTPFPGNGFCILLTASTSTSDVPLISWIWQVCPCAQCTPSGELTPVEITRDGSTVFLNTSSELSIFNCGLLWVWICLFFTSQENTHFLTPETTKIPVQGDMHLPAKLGLSTEVYKNSIQRKFTGYDNLWLHCGV